MVNDDARHVWLLAGGPGSGEVAAGLRACGWQVSMAATSAAFAAGTEVPDALVMLAPRLPDGCTGVELVTATAAAVSELVTATQEAVKRMARADKAGAIVIVTDIAGVPGRAGHAGQAAMSGALIGAGKCLAKELGRQDVSVNLVAHGLMPALGTSDGLNAAEAKLFGMMKLGKPGEIRHLINNIAHLIGSAHLMTGQVLHVDDGLVI